ncbi:MAG: phenylalanine--tRNA ligase subunit beta, partial [Bacteroidetes bacterium]|nr:phenylalanine--tRNA ligase subunit beta [Bacteroidota bacterium]
NDHLSIYITGIIQESSWSQPARKADFFYAKGIASALLQQAGIREGIWANASKQGMAEAQIFTCGNQELITVGRTSKASLKQFDIKQDVFFIDMHWNQLLQVASGKTMRYEEIARFPMVERDLSIVIQKQHSYAQVEAAVAAAQVKKLKHVSLFDVFESEKLGADKKSLALHFKFADEDKTLTDEEVENMMGKLMQSLEKNLNAEIRK